MAASRPREGSVALALLPEPPGLAADDERERGARETERAEPIRQRAKLIVLSRTAAGERAEPIIKSRDPTAPAPNPVVKAPNPVVVTPNPVVNIPKPIVKRGDPIVKRGGFRVKRAVGGDRRNGPIVNTIGSARMKSGRDVSAIVSGVKIIHPPIKTSVRGVLAIGRGGVTREGGMRIKGRGVSVTSPGGETIGPGGKTIGTGGKMIGPGGKTIDPGGKTIGPGGKMA